MQRETRIALDVSGLAPATSSRLRVGHAWLPPRPHVNVQILGVMAPATTS
jgi:hypothetical protein